jgi:hypothetical protein
MVLEEVQIPCQQLWFPFNYKRIFFFFEVPLMFHMYT